jgi:hypothetical protein
MIYKLFFILTIIFVLLRLVQKGRLGLDLASLTIIMILAVLGLSFSPYWVEKIATFLQFGTPSMSVVALVISGLTIVSMILSVMVSDLKRNQARMIRQIARLEIKILKS